MSDAGDEPTDPDHGVPDSDPDHIDPAGDVADLVEEGAIEMKLSDSQDAEELREMIASVENSEEPTDPGAVAVVRIARAMLEQTDE